MADSKSVTSSGVDFGGMLTIAFIVLKLCHVIDWSWLWVLAPIWIGFIAGALFMLIVWLFTRENY